MASSMSYTTESSKLEKLETFKFLTSVTDQHLKNIIFPLEKYTHRAGKVTQWAEHSPRAGRRT